MPEDASLESLLCATSLKTNGRISIDVGGDGMWRAGIVYYGGHHIHQPHPFGDPVEALRAALIEDERRSRDQVRRYEATPKIGAVATPSDVEDMLG